MQWEDTVMNKDQIAEVAYMAIESPDRGSDESWKSKQRNSAIARAQAEISFKAGYETYKKIAAEQLRAQGDVCHKAGINDVVEWIGEHRYQSRYLENDVMLSVEEWQAKCEEWGIDES